jgi:hypothetical protein
MASVISKLFGGNANLKNVNDIINDIKRGRTPTQDELDRANAHLKATGKPEFDGKAVKVFTPPAAVKAKSSVKPEPAEPELPKAT